MKRNELKKLIDKNQYYIDILTDHNKIKNFTKSEFKKMIYDVEERNSIIEKELRRNVFKSTSNIFSMFVYGFNVWAFGNTFFHIIFGNISPFVIVFSFMNMFVAYNMVKIMLENEKRREELFLENL